MKNSNNSFWNKQAQNYDYEKYYILITQLFTILCANSNINKMKKFDSIFKETCNSQISFYR